MAKTNAEKQRDFTARKKAEGLILFKAWLPPAVVEAVKKFLKELERGEK